MRVLLAPEQGAHLLDRLIEKQQAELFCADVEVQNLYGNLA